MTVAGALSWLLTIEIVPEALPDTFGEKLTKRVVLCPEESVKGSAAGERIKPAPDAFACEIVTAIVPEFVILTFCPLVVPTPTLPKLRVVGLTEIVAVDGESVFVEDVPLADVWPTHPDWIRVRTNIKPKNTKGLRGRCDPCLPTPALQTMMRAV